MENYVTALQAAIAQGNKTLNDEMIQIPILLSEATNAASVEGDWKGEMDNILTEWNSCSGNLDDTLQYHNPWGSQYLTKSQMIQLMTDMGLNVMSPQAPTWSYAGCSKTIRTIADTLMDTFSGDYMFYEDAKSVTEGYNKQIEAMDHRIGEKLTTATQLSEMSAEMSTVDDLTKNVQQVLQSLEKMLENDYQEILDQLVTHFANEELMQVGLGSALGGNLESWLSQVMDSVRWMQQQLDNSSTKIILQEEKLKTNAQGNDNESTYWWDYVADAFGANDGPNHAADRATIREANQVQQTLRTLKQELANSMFLSTMLQMLSVTLSQLKKVFEAFLQGHGNYLQLKDAMIEAFAILTEITASIMTQESSYQKQMSQGATSFSQGKLDQSLGEQQEIVRATHYANIMGAVLDVAKYLGIGLMFFMCPGVAMALMVLLDEVLNATGVMSKLQNALSNKLGAVWGAVLTGLIESVGTVGGAAFLEKAFAVLAERAAVIAMRSVEACVQSTVQEATDAGMEASIRETIELAAKTAREKVIAAFCSKSAPEFILALAKGELRVALVSAQKEAAQLAAQRLLENEADDVAVSSANKAVANAMKTSEKDAAKLGEQAGKQLAFRLGGMTVASMGSTQTINQIIAATHHTLNEGWTIALEVINMLQQMIGMIGACAAGSINMESAMGSGLLSKSFLATTTADGLAQVAGETGQAEADLHMAKAIKAIAKDQAAIELMQFVLEQLQKDGNQERNARIAEIEEGYNSTNRMAQNLSMAEQALAQALQTMAV